MSEEIIKISIGRKSKNPIQIRIKNDSVSEEHAVVAVSKSQAELTDLGSTNGTYVNGIKIYKSLITKQDMVGFGKIEIDGNKFHDLVQDRFEKFRTDYTSEFNELLPVMEEYQKKKDKIRSRPITPIALRIISAIVIIVILLYLDIPDNYRYPIIVVVGLFSTIGSLLGKSNITMTKEFDSLKLEYENKLLCPKKSCSNKLISENLTYWLGRRSCPRCEAKYK